VWEVLRVVCAVVLRVEAGRPMASDQVRMDSRRMDFRGGHGQDPGDPVVEGIRLEVLELLPGVLPADDSLRASNLLAVE
jgi:hypothetical protein